MTTQTKYDEALSVFDTLKLALEALEVANSCVDGYYIPKGKTHLPEVEQAITAIKEALQSNEQVEPVAVYGYCPECGAEGVARERRPDGNDCCANGHTYPSRTANKTPQRPSRSDMTWVGLTEEDVIDLWPDLIMHRHTYQFWQNLEAKLKEKNNGS